MVSRKGSVSLLLKKTTAIAAATRTMASTDKRQIALFRGF